MRCTGCDRTWRKTSERLSSSQITENIVTNSCIILWWIGAHLTDLKGIKTNIQHEVILAFTAAVSTFLITSLRGCYQVSSARWKGIHKYSSSKAVLVQVFSALTRNCIKTVTDVFLFLNCFISTLNSMRFQIWLAFKLRLFRYTKHSFTTWMKAEEIPTKKSTFPLPFKLKE